MTIQVVACTACQWHSSRHRREDGTYGVCNRCGHPMALRFLLADRQAAKARADLRRYELPEARL